MSQESTVSRIQAEVTHRSMVDHPVHYNNSASGVECIDVVEHMSFNLGNAMKYIWRCNDKNNAVEDLQKALWYIEREISRIKKGGN